MRLIDADRLKAVLENLKAHAEEHGIFPAFSVLVDYVIEVIGNQPTIVPPPNDPLTLEELREMDGEPVWIKSNNWHNKDKWGLVSVWTGPTGDKFAVYVYNTKTGATLYPSQEYGHCWLAYRRKPEEE